MLQAARTPDRSPQRTCRHRIATVMLLLGCGSSLSAADAVQKDIRREGVGRWAVLIGVDDYAAARKLRYCGADMRALAEQLIASGFPKDRIQLLHDQALQPKDRPTKTNIEAQLKAILGQVAKDDLVVIGFSGHGVHLKGKGYFCPSDAKLDDAQTLVALDGVYDRLDHCAAAFKLLIVDACRNDPQPEGASTHQATEGNRQFSNVLERPPAGILALTSCAPGELAREDEDLKHGVFMHFILEGLQGRADSDRNGRVSMSELYHFAHDRTKTYVGKKYSDSQRPGLKGDIHDDFDLTGPPESLAGPAMLSSHARSLLTGLALPRPVRIEVFRSPDPPEIWAQLQRDVLFLTQQIRDLCGAKLEVKVQTLRPDSPEAHRAAERFQITAHPARPPQVDGRAAQVILGVTVTGAGQSVVTPFVDDGMNLEYELVRSLLTVTQPTRKTIGILATAAPLLGRFDATRMVMNPEWPLVADLKKYYRVVEVDPAQPIEQRLDALVAVQPSSLAPEALQRFVDAVARGIPALICEDPCPMLFPDVAGTDAPPRRVGTNTMLGQVSPPPKGDLINLWQAIGAQVTSRDVIWQNYNPYVAQREFPREFVFIDEGSGAPQSFGGNDLIVAGLRRVVVPFPGACEPLAGAPGEFRPLLTTGSVCGTVPWGQVTQSQFDGSFSLNPDRRGRYTGQSYVLAAEVRTQTPRAVHAIVIGDIDLLTPAFWQLRDPSGTSPSYEFDNAMFALNAVDTLAGETRFQKLRPRPTARRSFARTPTAIEDSRRLAIAEQAIEDHYDAVLEKGRQESQRLLNESRTKLEQADLSVDEKRLRTALLEEVDRRREEGRLSHLQRLRQQALAKLRSGGTVETPFRVSPEDTADGGRLAPLWTDPLAVGSLEWTTYDQAANQVRSFKLARVRERWCLGWHLDLPVDRAEHFASVFAALFQASSSGGIAADAQERAARRLIAPQDASGSTAADAIGKQVTVRNRAGQVLLSLVVGNPVPERSDLRYVRVTDSDRVYAVRLDADRLSERVIDWVDTGLLPLHAWEMRNLEVRDYTGDDGKQRWSPQRRLLLDFDVDQRQWKLLESSLWRNSQWVNSPLPAGSQLATPALDDLRGTLLDLRFVGVGRLPKGIQAGLFVDDAARSSSQVQDALARRGFAIALANNRWEVVSSTREVHCTMADGLRYVVRVGGPVTDRRDGLFATEDPAGDYRHVLVKVEFEPTYLRKPDAEPQDTGGHAEYDQRVAKSKASAASLNARWSGLYYILRADAAQRLLTQCETLVPDLGVSVRSKPQ